MFDILGSIYRELRRKYYFTFRMDYVRKQLKKRKGRCGMHGCCQTQPKLVRCKFAKGKKCKVWKTNKMPFRCITYPFDEKDKSPFSRKVCNFRW
jgi:hypothetical protein